MNHSKDKSNSSKSARDVLQRLRHIAADRSVKLRFHQQYQEALEMLCETMQNPDREREVVWEQVGKLKKSGRPAPRHIPTLIELERITREAGGTAYVVVEQAIFEEMARLSHPDLIPFLLEAFRYRRRYDNFAARRREYATDIAATIAARTAAPQIAAVLDEMLADPKPEIRGVAMIIVYEAHDREGCEMSPALLDTFWRLGRHDPNRRVRQTALAVLQRVGEITYDEAMAQLERGD